MDCNGNDGLITSCCAEGRASSGDEPAVVGEARLPQPRSCTEEPAQVLVSALVSHLRPSVIDPLGQRSIYRLSLALGGDELLGCVAHVASSTVSL